MDAACPALVERCVPLLPPAEKAAVLSSANVDLQWIAERNSAVWTAGQAPGRAGVLTGVRSGVTGVVGREECSGVRQWRGSEGS